MKTILVNNFNDSNAIVEKIIPENWLSLSSDGTVLFGFSSDIKIYDVSENAYNTLKIPESVKTIAPHAFAYMFDGVTLEVSTLYLNSNLENIGVGAFRHCIGLKYVNFPQLQVGNHSLKSIGAQAFFESGITTDIVIPDTVQTIGERAFASCLQMTGNVVLPKSLVNVGTRAFAYLTSARKLNLSGYESIPNWMYDFKQTFLEFGTYQTRKTVCCQTQFNDLAEWQNVLSDRQGLIEKEMLNSFIFEILNVIPESYLWIENDQLLGFKPEADFEKLATFNVLKIPDNILRITDNAFRDTASEIPNAHFKIIFNEELTSIGVSAFEGCNWMIGQLHFNSTLTYIDDYAFKDCENITGSLDFGTTIDSLGKQAFANCKGISSLSFKNFYTTLSKETFTGMPLLSMIDISPFNNIPQWPQYTDGAFSNISKNGVMLLPPNLSSTDISKFQDSAITWGIVAEQEKDNWKFISYDASSTMYEDDLILSQKNTLLFGLTEKGLSKKNSIINFTIPNNVQYIEPNSFKDMFVVDSINDSTPKLILNLNDGLRTIDDQAFQNCNKIVYLSFLPKTLRKIGKNAFASCNNIRSNLFLNPGIETIDDDAFNDCESFTNSQLDLPSSLKYIGSNAFANTNFQTIKFNNIANLEIKDEVFNQNLDLSLVDLTECSYEQVLSWKYTHNSLKLSINEENEQKVIVKGGQIDDWKDLLYNQMGLPSQWEIEVEN